MLERKATLAALFGGLALTFGCRSPLLLIPADEIPPEIDYLALLPIVMGMVEPGSGLVSAHGPGQSALELSADADQFALAGYSAPQLTGVSADLLETSPLRRAEAGDATLPPPTLQRHLEFEEGRAVFGESFDVGALTARWAQCAFDPERYYLHVRCVSCSPFVELRREGCEVSVDLGGCFLGIDAIRVPLEGAGRFGAPTVTGQRCEVIADPGSSALAFECTIPQSPHQCRFDLIEKVSPAEVPFSVTSRALVSRPRAESNFEMRLEVYGRGYVPDLVVLGDRVIASVHDREPSTWYCVDGAAGTLTTLDADSLDVVSTTTAPPCLYTMAPSSSGEAFFALFGSDETSIGRFDATGALQAARSLSSFLPFPRSRGVDLELQPDGRLSALVNETLTDPNQPDLDSVWFSLDPLSLEVIDSIPLEGNHALLRVGPDGRSYAAHLATESITLLEPHGATASGSYRFLCDAAAMRVGDHVPRGGDRHLLVGRVLYPFIFEADFAGGSCARDAIAEVEADPASIIRWTEDQYLVTARGRDPERRALLLRMNGERLLLEPGALELGYGFTRLRRIDERGRIFGVASESGHVFRVDPR